MCVSECEFEFFSKTIGPVTKMLHNTNPKEILRITPTKVAVIHKIGGLFMAGEKQTIEIELNPDQVAFIGTVKDVYNIASEGKVMRIIMDYLQENKDVHDTVFKQWRCLRCAGARSNRIYG